MAISETHQITVNEAKTIVADYLSAKPGTTEADVKKFREKIEGRGIANLPEDTSLQTRLISVLES